MARLSREGVLETLQHLNRLTSYGVGFRSFTEQYFDSCGVFKDAVISILATIAKQERLRLSERTKAGLAQAHRNGRLLGRPRLNVNRDEIVRLRIRAFPAGNCARIENLRGLGPSLDVYCCVRNVLSDRAGKLSVHNANLLSLWCVNNARFCRSANDRVWIYSTPRFHRSVV